MDEILVRWLDVSVSLLIPNATANTKSKKNQEENEQKQTSTLQYSLQVFCCVRSNSIEKTTVFVFRKENVAFDDATQRGSTKNGVQYAISAAIVNIHHKTERVLCILAGKYAICLLSNNQIKYIIFDDSVLIVASRSLLMRLRTANKQLFQRNEH